MEGSGATFFFHVQFKVRDNSQKIARYQSSEPIMTNNETKKVKGHILHQGQCPLLQFQIKDSVLHWMGSSFVRVRLSSRATKPRVVVFCFFCMKVEHSVQWELYFGKVWKRIHEHFAHSAETSRAATTQSLTKVKKNREGGDTHCISKIHSIHHIHDKTSQAFCFRAILIFIFLNIGMGCKTERWTVWVLWLRGDCVLMIFLSFL